MIAIVLVPGFGGIALMWVLLSPGTVQLSCPTIMTESAYLITISYSPAKRPSRVMSPATAAK